MSRGLERLEAEGWRGQHRIDAMVHKEWHYAYAMATF